MSRTESACVNDKKLIHRLTKTSIAVQVNIQEHKKLNCDENEQDNQTYARETEFSTSCKNTYQTKDK